LEVRLTLLGFACHELGAGRLWVGRVPDGLMPSAAEFDRLWELHPGELHVITMPGGPVETPRFQKAFGVDYKYSGRVNKALPVSPLLEPFRRWARENINDALNGLLLNWYDGLQGHHIGRHKDSTKNLIPDTPIVTISLGEERTFRLRPWPAQAGGKRTDFPARNGTVFVLPWKTNQNFTHEVPHSTRRTGRRISVTLRAFANGQPI